MSAVFDDTFLRVQVLDKLQCRVIAVEPSFVEVDRWDCIDCNRHRGRDAWRFGDLCEDDRETVKAGDEFEQTTTRETDGRGNVSVVTRIRRVR